jgi:intracellular sulfur oxidation DsrE/DsrF family protein
VFFLGLFFAFLPFVNAQTNQSTNDDALKMVADSAAKARKDNPNSQLILDLMKNGSKLIACGQAMMFLDVKKEELFPGVKVSLTAQTVLSNYIGQGYVLYSINDDRK